MRARISASSLGRPQRLRDFQRQYSAIFNTNLSPYEFITRKGVPGERVYRLMSPTPEAETLFWISPDTWICLSRGMRSFMARNVPAERLLSFTQRTENGKSGRRWRRCGCQTAGATELPQVRRVDAAARGPRGAGRRVSGAQLRCRTPWSGGVAAATPPLQNVLRCSRAKSEVLEQKSLLPDEKRSESCPR